VAENTMSQWSRGIVATPKWANIMFDLLLQKKLDENQKKIIQEAINLLQSLQK
jgi:hypothetical protein